MGRQLDRAPGERYGPARPDGVRRDGRRPSEVDEPRASLAGPLARALVAAVLGGGAIVVVSGIFSSTAGLLVIAGLTGAAIGLLLARAAVPDGLAAPRITRPRASTLAAGLALGAMLAAALGTWLLARGEGGVLGPVDYLWETFGLLVPAEAIVAAMAAAWGAGAGPVQRG